MGFPLGSPQFLSPHHPSAIPGLSQLGCSPSAAESAHSELELRLLAAPLQIFGPHTNVNFSASFQPGKVAPPGMGGMAAPVQEGTIVTERSCAEGIGWGMPNVGCWEEAVVSQQP